MVVISPLVEIGADVKVYTGFFENDESLTKALVGRLWWLFFLLFSGFDRAVNYLHNLKDMQPKLRIHP